MISSERRDKILVSVLIPAYNAGATLGETLRSVLAQTHPTLDVVVVDDGSRDDTAAVAASFGERVRVIRQENSGIATARNASLRAARSDFMALLDADDICEPERIAVQLKFMLEHPDLLLCSSDFSGFDHTGMLARSYCGEYYSRCSAEQGGPQARYPDHGELDITDCLEPGTEKPASVRIMHGRVYEELTLGNFVHPPTVMFRRQAIERAGIFDQNVRIVCEWEWFVRVARQGPIGYVDRPLLRYRRSPSQITLNPLTAEDSLRVALLIHRRDPELRRRAPQEVRRHLGRLSLSAAYALASERRIRSLGLLAVSAVRYRTIDSRSLVTLAKALLPRAGLRLLRKMRSRR